MRARLEAINRRIAAACGRAGRQVSEITLVAASKTVPAPRIREAIEAGVRVIGENRVQEAATKISELGAIAAEHGAIAAEHGAIAAEHGAIAAEHGAIAAEHGAIAAEHGAIAAEHGAIAAEHGAIAADYKVQWHLIGRLQSNKARRAVELFDVVQSVESLKLAERLDHIAGELGKRLPIFIEVNLGGEASKAGAVPDEVLSLCEQISKLSNLELKGLMAVPPFFDNPEDARPFFQRLRRMRDRAAEAGAAGEQFNDLSMGMSNDFEVAIEEGATLVRIGTELFGARDHT